MERSVRIAATILKAMLRHARAEMPRECCGLLAGRGAVIIEIFSAKNMLASPTAYSIAPQELFESFRDMRARNLDHLGIYHSHPSGENTPSPLDIERAFDLHVAYFIVSPRTETPQPVRAFAICDGRAEELTVEIAQT